MIEFRHFSFTYTGASEQALRDISFTIRQGECVLIHGPSGCGKSTLLMTLNGIIPSILHGKTEGDVLINGQSTAGHQTKELATMVGMVFQNPDNQLFAITVEEDVAFGPENLGREIGEIGKRVDTALESTGMAAFRRKQVHRLSGGQKQRTAIAGLCAMQPDILVFDEPTADLDPEGSREVIAMIDRLHRKERKTVVIVEHKTREVMPIVDRVVTLREGKVEQEIPKKELDTRVFIPEYPQLTNQERETGPPLLDIRKLCYTYPDGTQSLGPVSFSVNRGECIAVIGRNGSGKTTLTKCIKGLLKPASGTIALYSSTDGSVVRDRARYIGYLFQNPDHQIVTDQVEREIAIGLAGRTDAEIKRITRESLERVNLLSLSGRDPCTLSRGERQRLAFASVFALDPNIIIFDEPTTGQDPENLEAIMGALEMMKQQGKTILMVTHDHELAHAYADRIIRMEDGKAAEEIIPKL